MSAEPLSAEDARRVRWDAGSRLIEAIAATTRLINPRVSEIDWDAVAAALDGALAPALVTARDAHFFEAGIAEGKRLAAEAPYVPPVERPSIPPDNAR